MQLNSLLVFAVLGCAAALSGKRNAMNILYEQLFDLGFPALDNGVGAVYDAKDGTFALSRAADGEVLRTGTFTEDGKRKPMPDAMDEAQLAAADMVSFKSYYVNGRVDVAETGVNNFGVVAQISVETRKNNEELTVIVFLEHSGLGRNALTNMRESLKNAFATTKDENPLAAPKVPAESTLALNLAAPSTSCIDACDKDRNDARNECVDDRNDDAKQCQTNLNLCSIAGCDVGLAAASVGCLASLFFYPVCMATAAGVFATCQTACFVAADRCSGRMNADYSSCLLAADRAMEPCVNSRCDESSKCPLVGAYYQASQTTDIGGIYTYQNCQARCEAAPTCNAWTWRAGNHGSMPNSCALHRRVHGNVHRDSIYPNGAVHYSCPTSVCHDPRDDDNNCLEHGGWDAKNVIAEQRDVTSTDVCQNLCQANPQCQAYIHRASRHPLIPNSCVLQSSANGPNQNDETGFPLGELIHFSCSQRECVRPLGQPNE